MGLRVHRAISWIGRAEVCGTDADAKFIFLWIAFNAAYAQLYGDRPLTMRPNAAIIVNRSISTRREVRAARGGAK